MNEIERWYLNARHKYVWDKDTIADYVEVIVEIVHSLIEEVVSDTKAIERLASPHIGFFHVIDSQKSEEPLIGYALYIADIRLANIGNTLFSSFKHIYRIHVGADEFARMMNDEKFIRENFPDRAEILIERARERAKLVRHFESLANKSLNHRRAISPRIRYLVLQRDKYTCQACGRRAPEVKLHIDHIRPVSWETDWKPSNNHSDYQVLCENCNLGKGTLSWMLNEL